VTSQQAPRRIKRYGNRKLYDLDAKRYVTLEDVAGMVASGQDVEVIDQRTGEDLTSLTLAQVLLEGLKEKTARIPRQVLVRLVRIAAGPASAFSDWPAPHEAATRERSRRWWEVCCGAASASRRPWPCVDVARLHGIVSGPDRGACPGPVRSPDPDPEPPHSQGRPDGAPEDGGDAPPRPASARP
jgi:polyhydroxyalkanoate synthesis repressor PhaR